MEIKSLNYNWICLCAIRKSFLMIMCNMLQAWNHFNHMCTMHIYYSYYYAQCDIRVVQKKLKNNF